MTPDSRIRWRAYPAALAAGCLAAGVLLAEACPDVGPWGWMALSPAVVPLLVLARPRRRLVSPAPAALYAATAFALLLLGATLRAYEDVHPPHHLAARLPHAPVPVVVEGRVAGEPVSRAYGVQFAFEVQREHRATGTIPAAGRLHVVLLQQVPGQPLPAPAWGDLLRLQGRLEPLPRRRNPADFDYGAYLGRRGYVARLLVEDPGAVTILGRDRTLPLRITMTARAFIRAQVDRHVPGTPARAVLLALLLGDRTGIEPGTRTRFAETGLMHVLAVSGLHVLLVGFVFYGLLRPLLMRLSRGRLAWRAVEHVRAGLTLALLVAYVVLTGAPASAVRAVTMAAVLIGLNVFQRNAPTLNALGVAAFVMLLFRPRWLFDVGFQLSFAAVAGIVTLCPVLQRALPAAWLGRAAWRRTASFVLVSLAATLATMPVLLHHFGHASFAGLVLNLAAIPLTAATLLAGLLMVVFGGFPALASLFGAAAGGFATLLLRTADAGVAYLGRMSVRGYVDDPWLLLAMGVALVMLAQWPRPRTRWRLAVLAGACVAVSVWTEALRRPALDVLFFDVGQGDAALITLPNGRHLLVDAGVRNAYTDQGLATLLPHLRRYGIRRLDAVVVSHPHSDHLGGLPALLRSVPVGRVLHNGDLHPSALYEEAHHLLDSLRVPHRALHAGDTLRLDPSVRLQVLAPARPPADGDEANEASLVLRLVYGATTVLFMGDAEAGAEARLIRHYGPLLRSDVVKVGHHGSATSSIPAFVAAVTAGGGSPLAVVSAGHRNRFGFPDPEVVRRWEAHGARVWVTGAHGALWLRSDGRQVRRVRW
ncbi:DNA internalization-related competence protein ComEC/Rec2 [Rhodocaloribacter litoris]|uniref:DNA internalization-related competence protein ComEC/Rec2 n=1 Tax=Rhodocaloribacter litoris TaxID=2558931 RepID=UPI0014217D12|nr:DNA internalization-related competence protein ComEC/Rec2 [Rhodocaloribacter litoris]QXD13744.1 DNA internalization-related competence protein ComEC/Rec2 [Rhodocaloribacter litoris]